MEAMRRGALAAIGAAVAVIFRVPALMSSVQLSYDDGVYGASTALMAAGMTPFRDFFSSQGPVFLPTLRFFDAVGLGGITAPRVAMVVAGAAIAALVFFLVRRDEDDITAMAISVVAASSGLMLLAAGRLHSDGLAIAFGLGALVVAVSRRIPLPWRSVLAGVLIALAMATKSLHLVPTALVVFAVLWLAGRWLSVATAAVAAAGTGVVVTLPFGLGPVFEQYVVFHIQKDDTVIAVDNLVGLNELFWLHDLPVMVLSLFALLGLLVGKRVGRGHSALPSWLLWSWLAISLGLLVFTQPIVGGFERFGAILLPPLLLLLSRAHIKPAVLLTVAIVAIPFQWLTLAATDVRSQGASEAAAVASLRLIPDEGFVVTDRPGIAWFSEQPSHPDTVDSSFGSIGAGRMTADVLFDAISDDRTCAVVSWSTRFASLGLAGPPDGYEVAFEEEGRFVALRRACLD